MSESPRQFENIPAKEDFLALEKIAQHPYIVSAEVSPFQELVASHEINPELEERLHTALGKHFELFTEVVEGIKLYLNGPLIKDTFGNKHLESSEKHDGLSRREFIRSFGDGTFERNLFDRNRLKLGTHCNVIFPRIEMLKMFAGEGAGEIQSLFSEIPLEAYEKMLAQEELTEEEKEEWVHQMDAFGVHFLERLAA